MFRKLLIANRGEIACRIMRTARRLGIATVAVHADPDAGALHVASADEAVALGGTTARESYLDIGKIVAAARACGAEAVHPGYGFLAENADLAEACAEAGLIFVGPPAAAIRAMGSKSGAKALMEKAGVPLLSGYHGDDQSASGLAKAAKRIGFPVLIKPSAGGGGKGMRRVETAETFLEALVGAKREAKSAFGDEQVLIEKYLHGPRHIEVQVFADSHGNVVHLFERDCSLQRRHQKVIEEAPAPGMTVGLRQAMTEAALTAARAIGYVGAGTIEFLVEPGGQFYFMEMNTRLQVEHPVTEAITGLDLVEWQLRVAAGEKLPLAQQDIILTGHAFEARLYAEDPARDFLPASGRLAHLRLPRPETARVDAGVRQGDTVGIHYDPLLAKIVTWGPDRASALARLQTALGTCQVVGPATNAEFLAVLAAHPEFVAGRPDIGFIERHRAELAVPAAPLDEALVLASLGLVLRREAGAGAAAAQSNDPGSPWHRSDGWRLNGAASEIVSLRQGDVEHRVELARRDGGFVLGLPGDERSASASLSGHEGEASDIETQWSGQSRAATVVRHGWQVVVFGQGWRQVFELGGPRFAGAEEQASGKLTAPMPGRIAQVLAQAGQAVKRGQVLVIVEAMKMEHGITAPADGTVTEVRYRVGDLVEEGVELIDFAEAE
jgi:3-methylcrotonyl-CoA carboxylase alpha subunit